MRMTRHSQKDMTKNLSVDGVEVFRDRTGNIGTFRILWSGDIGYGEYTLRIEQERITADSETMDSGKDKAFLKRLLELLLEKVKVTG
jgi:hypothetical protein